MSKSLHPLRFPNENDAYRNARDELLAAEVALRQQIEDVAAKRRGLPPGGRIGDDYAFTELGRDGTPKTVKLSELFGDKKTLVLYSLMYGPAMKSACPYCTSILDGLNGATRHVTPYVAFAAVAKSPIERIEAYRRERGWDRLRLLSSAGTSYNGDYHGETPDGNQIPMLNVFTKTDDGVHHSYGTELLFVPWDGGDPRHVDQLWPVWNIFDLTPDGRDDRPVKLSYD